VDNLDLLRDSALANVAPTAIETDEVNLNEVSNLRLFQVAVWPESIVAVRKKLLEQVGVASALGQGFAVEGDTAAILSVEPLKFWQYGGVPLTVIPSEGAFLDISHSRTHLRLTGPGTTNLLNKHMSIDLRPEYFPVGRVASTGIHHVGVTLWRNEDCFNLFVPRAFAVAIWQILIASIVGK